MNKITTKVLSSALFVTVSFFASGVQISAQQQLKTSGLSNAPIIKDEQDARTSEVINKAEIYFHEGEIHLKDRQLTQAREKFDKAVETILLSGLNVRNNAKLFAYYSELVDKVYKLEIPNAPSVVKPAANPGELVASETEVQIPIETIVGFGEQKYEASPRDELAQFKLTEEEVAVAATPEAQQEAVQIQAAVNRGSLGFSFQMHPLVQQFVAMYQGRGRTTMSTGLEKSGQFTRMARRIFREEGVPENIVWLGQVESAWKPWARSWAAASGLWQFIPGTGARYGLRQNAYLDERHNYEKATRASAKYLKFLADRYNGNWELAMAGYNCGEGNVDKAIRKAGVNNFWAAYPYLPGETRNYVPNILATILIANAPDNYGFGHVKPMPPLIYDRVRVPSATSLNLIAQATDTSVDVLRYLNPDLRQGSTPPEAYILNVPAGKSNQLVAVLRRVPSNSRNTAAITTIGRGEDIQSIANRTGATTEQIQTLNNGVDLSKTNKVIVPNNNVTKTAYVRPTSKPAPIVSKQISSKITAQPGDTIRKVAARYGLDALKLARENGVPVDSPLAPGREIRVR